MLHAGSVPNRNAARPFKLVTRDASGVPGHGGMINSRLFDADAMGNCLAALGFNPRRSAWILRAGLPDRAIEEPARPLGHLAREARA